MPFISEAPVILDQYDKVDFDSVNIVLSNPPAISYVIAYYDDDTKIRQKVVTVAPEEIDSDAAKAYYGVIRPMLEAHARKHEYLREEFKESDESTQNT